MMCSRRNTLFLGLSTVKLPATMVTGSFIHNPATQWWPTIRKPIKTHEESLWESTWSTIWFVAIGTRTHSRLLTQRPVWSRRRAVESQLLWFLPRALNGSLPTDSSRDGGLYMWNRRAVTSAKEQMPCLGVQYRGEAAVAQISLAAPGLEPDGGSQAPEEEAI
jgi:hypothetical protein